MTRRRNRHKPKAYYMKNNHVYIVLEHSELHLVEATSNNIDMQTTDAVVHGVYTNRDMAQHKVYRLKNANVTDGYLCIIEQRIKGNIYTEEREPTEVLSKIFDW
jgi:hypothetical protein